MAAAGYQPNGFLRLQAVAATKYEGIMSNIVHILTVEKDILVTDEKAKELKKSLRKAFGGGKVLILEGGITYSQYKAEAK